MSTTNLACRVPFSDRSALANTLSRARSRVAAFASLMLNQRDETSHPQQKITFDGAAYGPARSVALSPGQVSIAPTRRHCKFPARPSAPSLPRRPSAECVRARFPEVRAAC